MVTRKTSLTNLNKQIIHCKKCPRLSSYIKNVAQKKVKRFKDEKYWGLPLTGFGDINAELLLVGLAPAAHGGNRTGRMFTGDSSGDWVAKVLFKNKFANKPTSISIDDGFTLVNTYITATVRCAPPQNKPLKEEFDNCFSYLIDEISILKNVKVIICLGKIAFNSCCKLLNVKGLMFGHGKLYYNKQFAVICSYHPSKQNTQTGRLTWKQWNSVFRKAKKILDKN